MGFSFLDQGPPERSVKSGWAQERHGVGEGGEEAGRWIIILGS